MLLLFVLTVVFFNKLLFAGQTLAQPDFNNIQVTLMQFFHEALTKYQLPPFWNSRFGGGFDAFANPLAPYFSPFAWLFLYDSSIYHAFNIFILLQVFLGSAFAFLLLRNLNFSRGASFAGAIVFSFNGFVTMRLSPGVGVEYLFAYKWLPLLFLFAQKYLESGKLRDLVLLAIPVAFLFEGNSNLAVVSLLLLGVYLVMTLRKFLRRLPGFVLLAFLSFSLFAIKLLPAFNVLTLEASRFSGAVSGWRAEKIMPAEFLSYFIPRAQSFGFGIFTPGLIGIVICCIGAVGLFLSRKYWSGFSLFAVVSLILGSVLVTYNPVSEFILGLPVFNQLTVVPTFLVFLVIPLVFFAAVGVSLLRIEALAYLVGLAIFTEVLIGYPALGSDTYTFNFKKAPIAEVKRFPHYNALAGMPEGLIYVSEPYRYYLYPYAASLSDLYFLNGYTYFFGSNMNEAIAQYDEVFGSAQYTYQKLDASKIQNICTYSSYILSPFDLELPMAGKVEYLAIDDFEHMAVGLYAPHIRDLHLHGGWDGVLRIYTTAESSVSAVKKLDTHPTRFGFDARTNNFVDNKLVTALNYSPFWWSTNTDYKLSQNTFGYLVLEGVRPGEWVELVYINPYIYIGFLFSLLAFVFVCKTVRKPY